MQHVRTRVYSHLHGVPVVQMRHVDLVHDYLCIVPSVDCLSDFPLVPAKRSRAPSASYLGFGRNITIGRANRSGTTVLKRYLVAVSVNDLEQANTNRPCQRTYK
jgi:hypothetical protein